MKINIIFDAPKFLLKSKTNDSFWWRLQSLGHLTLKWRYQVVYTMVMSILF